MRPNKAETAVQGLSFTRSLVIFLTHTYTHALMHNTPAQFYLNHIQNKSSQMSLNSNPFSLFRVIFPFLSYLWMRRASLILERRTRTNTSLENIQRIRSWQGVSTPFFPFMHWCRAGFEACDEECLARWKSSACGHWKPIVIVCDGHLSSCVSSVLF